MSTEDRLALLDRLLEQGAITEDERAEQRARIPGELKRTLRQVCAVRAGARFVRTCT